MRTFHRRLAVFWVAAMLVPALGCRSSERGEGGAGGPRRGGDRDHRNGPGGAAADKEAVPVEVGEVTRQEMASLYSTSATLRAERRATVTTRTSGVLDRLLVEEGDRIREGQALAELDNEEQRIAWERSKATRSTREQEFGRLERLFGQELVSQDELERARRDYLDAKHAAELAELELSRTVIRAPFAGVVVARHLDVGNTVTQGTPVYDLADIDPLYTDVNVPERHVSRLSAGQAVRLTPDTADAPVDAVIERVAPAVDPATGTVKVTLAVQEAPALRPGTFVRVDIITDTHHDALVVPRSALVAEGRRWYVYRTDGEEARKLEVTLGYESRDRVEVLPVDGLELEAGATVVVAGAGALDDGSPIRVVGQEAGAA